MRIMKCLIFSILLMFNMALSSAQSKLGLFDRNLDIGNCRHPGFASYDQESQHYLIGGAGANMWFHQDQFHYLWTTIQGDFILRAEVKFIGAGVDPHRKTGWMVRNSLGENEAHVNAAVHGDGLTSLQFRNERGALTIEEQMELSAPNVIQLERRGDIFIMSAAKFGNSFTSIQTSISLDQEVYIGLYVCSHNENILETVEFRNVRIIKPVKEDYIPYRDYIGSNLEILDIDSGDRKIIYHSAHSIQAPNWTTDGRQLIYNSKGLLYQYNLPTGDIDVLNTGFANSNNNDHVLTFDGKLMGISHHNADDEGNSSIYYLPVQGDSIPKKVTKDGVGASYLHSWSPDKRKMLFTGHRKGQYDIYSVNVETGKETQLTNEKTLDDGSEYSPDGQYIFFNSARTGKMKLWRMDADGKEPKQLTFDGYNDWFPHVSPDMKWIIFISYPKDIDPTTHPFYKHCLLRIMPYTGGEPRVIGYIYGGQGSINVPSWSPDSKKVAFVSNSQ